MESRMPDEELWSLVDRGGAAVEEHLARHPGDRARVAELAGAIGAAAHVLGAVAVLPPERIGSYRVEREIGRGGGGVVYEAWQEDPPRRVALKVLRDCDHADVGALARLRREAEALGRLSHPHVAVIFEAGRTSAGHPFLAMELVHGPTLTDHLKLHAPSVRERVRLFRDICDGVHHAHKQGVVHRDLKASNVLVDEELGVKVVDFGLARLRDAAAVHVTQSGIVVGTLGYMSPEQARGEPVDERTDVYSLGVVLYEMLTGSLPFDLSGRSALDAARIVAESRPRAPRSRRPDLDRELETIVLKALEKDPEQRYGSAAALAEDVGCWLAGRPILARRPSVRYRLRKLASRNRFVTALLSVLLLVSLVAGWAATFRPRIVPLSGEWYATLSPFDGVRWVGERPQVDVGGTWYDLVSIDGLHADYVIGFCKQEAPRIWRKRFSEDLLQVLNLMGRWPIRSVDLVLREPDTGTIVERPGVTLDPRKRQAIMWDRYAWPLHPAFDRGGPGQVEHEGRTYELLAVDGVRADTAAPARGWNLLDYDRYCDVVGRSPGPTVRLELRDVETGEMHVLEDVARDPTRPLVVTTR